MTRVALEHDGELRPSARAPASVLPGSVLLGGLVIALLGAMLISLEFGATGIGLDRLPALILARLSGQPLSADQQSAWLILLAIRMPRAVLGLAAGGALGASGAVMQGLFRNPLADPGLIGVSAGAALATAATIVLGDGVLAFLLQPLGAWAAPIAGLGGGLATTLLLYVLATRQGATSIGVVLLGGMALSAFAGALTGVLVFLANDQQLRDLTFWTLGSLSGASWPRIAAQLPFLAVGAACLAPLAHTLNALLLGEADAFHMGARVERAKRLSLLGVACLVGATVSSVGVIGFVGVLVPNLARLVCGPDHRIVLPASALLGAILLLLSDTIARTIAAPAEMPVGVVTAVIGAPCFFWLLLRDREALR
jgi:iron complex transport system permease protein